ncbi:MAG: ABC transporter ATP-binding protein [Leptolyngbya sp. SIO1E4]|nr:ABC transporter ATP-binding protein [Leptolyngbya sp. SIO1E4]
MHSTQIPQLEATLGSVAIQVEALCKRYGKLAAVRGVTFTVQRGEIFGLIGPDGAGKTTLFQILAGVMEATGGEISILGAAPRDVRLQTGYLTQHFSLYLDLSLDENLRYAAGLHEVPTERFRERRTQYLRLMNLEPFADRLAGQLSGGMKQKLALCCALIAQPQILLLDEPTTGVDPVSRREFWDVLATLSHQGVTIVVATPYMDEAERCHRVALMYDGQIQQMGTPTQLQNNLGLQRLEVRVSSLKTAEQALLKTDAHQATQIVDVQTFGDRLDVLVDDVQAGEIQVRTLLAVHQLAIDTIRPANPTLENVFVTQLRQQGLDPPFIPFPGRRRGWRSREGKEGGEGRGNREDIVSAPPSLLSIATPPTPPTPPSPHPATHQSPTTVSEIAIGARDLSKTFGNFQAVKGVNLDIHYGEIYGLLGANGAGKTTTIKMLCGLLGITRGEVMLAGQTRDLRSSALRQRIGYMSQKFTLYDDLSIQQNLEFYCGVYGIPRHQRRAKIDWVLDICGLTGKADLITGQLPGGWKKRVAFGASVMHEPEILFLDEPTSGVDPLARRQFWRLIEDLTHQGTAVLVTTHYLEEAEHCNRMAFMAAGEVVAQGSPNQIKASQPGQLFEVKVDQPQAASDFLKQYFDSWRVSLFGDRLHIVLDQPDTGVPQLRSLLKTAAFDMQALQSVPFSLEDAFIGIMQRA